MNRLERKWIVIWLIASLILLPAIYFQGLSGPFLFDDYSNIVDNSYLRIDSLDYKSLSEAAFSGSAGPLRRPISVGSFAINYYLAGAHNPFYLKLTNVLIHSLNFILIFLLICLLHKFTRPKDPNFHIGNPYFLPFAVALIWAYHPIQLTSVLYIVQRMTSLAGLFSLLTIIFYFYIRSARTLSTAVFFSILSLISLLLGIFSKENALLTPLIIILIESVIFREKNPWAFLLYKFEKHKIASALLFSILVVVILYITYKANILNGYDGRNFTLIERLLTESRVLFYYLALIIFPRINDFGIFHDDISISHSLLTPYTTLLSIVGHLTIITSATRLRKKIPLFTIGIGIFYIGHLMESTVIPLEIAHEHRNYFPSIGVILALGALLRYTLVNLNHRIRAIPLLVIIFIIVTSTTAFRAYQWSNDLRMANFEATHHPNSANTQLLLSRAAFLNNDYKQAYIALLTAQKLRPDDPGFLFNLAVLSESLNVPLSDDKNRKLLNQLRTEPLSATTKYIMASIGNCILDKCTGLQNKYETWLKAALDNQTNTVDKSLIYYDLGLTYTGQGRYADALNALDHASKLDPTFLHPLIVMIDLLIKLDDYQHASMVMDWLKKNNSQSNYQRNTEIEELEEKLNKHLSK